MKHNIYLILSLVLIVVFSFSCSNDLVSNESGLAGETLDNFSRTSVGGEVTSINSRIVGSNPYTTPESITNLPPGYVVTGIGLRTSSKAVTTIVLEARYLNSNGTMETPQKFYYGTDPYHENIEVEGSVYSNLGLDNAVIVGIGARIDDNDAFTTMRLYYRTFIPGTTTLDTRLYSANFGRDATHALEAVVYTDLYGNAGGNLYKKVLVGIGVTNDNNEVVLLQMHEGVLK